MTSFAANLEFSGFLYRESDSRSSRSPLLPAEVLRTSRVRARREGLMPPSIRSRKSQSSTGAPVVPRPTIDFDGLFHSSEYRRREKVKAKEFSILSETTPAPEARPTIESFASDSSIATASTTSTATSASSRQSSLFSTLHDRSSVSSLATTIYSTPMLDPSEDVKPASPPIKYGMPSPRIHVTYKGLCQETIEAFSEPEPQTTRPKYTEDAPDLAFVRFPLDFRICPYFMEEAESRTKRPKRKHVAHSAPGRLGSPMVKMCNPDVPSSWPPRRMFPPNVPRHPKFTREETAEQLREFNGEDEEIEEVIPPRKRAPVSDAFKAAQRQTRKWAKWVLMSTGKPKGVRNATEPLQ